MKTRIFFFALLFACVGNSALAADAQCSIQVGQHSSQNEWQYQFTVSGTNHSKEYAKSAAMQILTESGLPIIQAKIDAYAYSNDTFSTSSRKSWNRFTFVEGMTPEQKKEVRKKEVQEAREAVKNSTCKVFGFSR